MPYPTGLELIQIAREGTAGTDLATTSKIFATSFNAVPMDEVYRPPVLRGAISRNRGFETVVKRWSEITIEGDLSFQQAQHWFIGALGNDAAPTGSDPYTWDLIRDPTAVPTLGHFTIERRITDGSTPIQQAWHYCTVRSLTITFADGEPVKFSVTLFGRRVQTETLTAGQSLPTAVLMPLGLGKLWIDSAWASLGTTVVASQVLSGEWTFNTGAVPIWTLDQRSDLDWGVVGYNAEETSIEARITALVGGQYATEKTAAEAQTLRAMRLQFDGASSSQLLVDWLCKHSMGSLFEFGVQDGQHIVEMNFVESTDGTNLAAAKVVNAVSAFA